MIPKVLAYILQNNRILIFRHRDYPHAGMQIPAGTVDPGENPEEAVLREVEEESGLTDLHVEEKLGMFPYFHDYKKEWHERHVFILRSKKPLPECWTHTVSNGSEDKGVVLEYFWLPITHIHVLAVSQGEYFPSNSL